MIVVVYIIGGRVIFIEIVIKCRYPQKYLQFNVQTPVLVVPIVA